MNALSVKHAALKSYKMVKQEVLFLSNVIIHNPCTSIGLSDCVSEAGSAEKPEELIHFINAFSKNAELKLLNI